MSIGGKLHASIFFPSQDSYVQYFKIRILNMYSCAWKPDFLSYSQKICDQIRKNSPFGYIHNFQPQILISKVKTAIKYLFYLR